jgi:hypothetical protein
MKNVRRWAPAIALAAVIGLVYAGSRGSAAGGDGPKGDVVKIAAAVSSGDLAAAKKLAAGVAGKADDIEDVMHLFATKKKGGIAWKGAKDSEGIEMKVREVARDGPKNIAKETALFQELADNTIAIGLVAEAWTSKVKDKGKQTRKAWEQYSADMLTAAQGLSKAVKSKGAADVKAAATKLNNSCNACHADFRN